MGKLLAVQVALRLVEMTLFKIFIDWHYVKNKGDCQKMVKATHAILKHYCSTAENPCHEDTYAHKILAPGWGREGEILFGWNILGPPQDPGK